MAWPESAALLPSSSASSRLQPAQQNPLSKLTISSWSFACFLTSGRRLAQAEISHTENLAHTHEGEEYSESWLLTTLQYYNLGLWRGDIRQCVERMKSQPNPRQRERKKAADLTIQLSAETLKTTPAAPKSFGTVFTDHMLTIEWTKAEGWGAPRIEPFRNLSMHPACTSLHYGIQLFEGLKAYNGEDKRLRLFRPMLNMKRMSKSAKRVCLPAFDESELVECIRRLVEIDQDWAFLSESSSHLYIRPTFISTEATLGLKKPTRALLYVIICLVGSYFSSGSEGLSLWADTKYIRAAKGGNGDCKLGGNYGGSLAAQYEAQDFGCQQVLWLYGDDHQITEAGTMNIFLYWINEDGVEELATPPLDGIILPGVTRQSILEITRKWGEFAVSERYLTMDQLCSALEQQRVKEMFGSGTACMICHLSQIVYKGEKLSLPGLTENSLLSSRITKEIENIQYGRTPSDWTLLV